MGKESMVKKTMISLEDAVDKKLKGYLMKKYGTTGKFKSYTVNRAIEEYIEKSISTG